ncbi:MAG: cell division ATP-binding protein FtsE [Desulfovibrionales bacterium]|nr:cell division ATP-binding protein FtsE [Desulfovibrionales bacterium]
MDSPLIELKHVYKSYEQDLTVLEDINLRIGKGEFVFVNGPSGAGKTTLLKVMLCLERSTKGEVWVDGINLKRLANYKIPYLRRRMGMVFQDFKLIENLTVFENVALAMEVCGVKKSVIEHKVDQVLKSLGLEIKKRIYPRRLSGGEQQRVAIARAVVNDPLVLLADEPTGNLDAGRAADIMSLFNEISARGTTVIFATHNQELIRSTAKRVIILDQGRIVT